MTMQPEEVRSWLVSLLPPGVRDHYDLDHRASDVSRFFDALADAAKLFGPDVVDRLRDEVVPHRATEKLVDWEEALALTSTLASGGASLGARRAAILGRLRESGSYTLPNIQAIVGPLLGYLDPTQLSVVETDRR